MIRRLLSPLLAQVKTHAAFLVLLAVAGAGCWLYVLFQQVRAERDQLAHTAELICAGAGVDFAASSTAETAIGGKRVTVAHERGAVCQRTVAGLQRFRAETDQATAATLAQALKDHDARQAGDTLAARSAAEAARTAAMKMEIAENEAERRNLVDREWFAAVNGVAGLRPAPAR
ncbi:hypothetical protein [Sphingomonas aracearum]|uniref:Uncharacterized protein n=1 Tax=Sphingomonas aracearum TaxID=2283317 RepID=A0A369VQN2_9SPHN|nr:hypothetical protein [Sphingomonas aracearum]RDE04694.1 hypothetical protein DVW87_13980 [Sphingomonas aracearum]